ncbi:MAG: hypothetical protein JST40_09720 [Armatimonadetes bacterium]|nr:hypothetical protein [Armatimonadota bacterium]
MYRNKGYSPQRDANDTVTGILESLARLLFWGGLLGVLVALGFLGYYFSVFSSSSIPPAQQQQSIALMYKLLLPCIFAVGVGSSFLFWSEEVLGPLQLIGAALLYFAPVYLPTVLSVSNITSGSSAAAQTIQMSGLILGAFAALCITADLSSRIKLRVREGAKADQIKIGKGIKEERDIQNVFLGKCWQLPYCRKFVREKCPIYHAKRTCWKERVGCMCEETVINNAMLGKVVPKDSLTAVSLIPRNDKIGPIAKAERCRQCVIYNEHQKHKYKAALPAVMILIASMYIFGKGMLLTMLAGVLHSAEKVLSVATFQQDGKPLAPNDSQMMWFQEILLVAILFVLMAYLLKLVEYLVFKLKI